MEVLEGSLSLKINYFNCQLDNYIRSNESKNESTSTSQIQILKSDLNPEVLDTENEIKKISRSIFNLGTLATKLVLTIIKSNITFLINSYGPRNGTVFLKNETFECYQKSIEILKIFNLEEKFLKVDTVKKLEIFQMSISRATKKAMSKLIKNRIIQAIKIFDCLFVRSVNFRNLAVDQVGEIFVEKLAFFGATSMIAFNSTFNKSRQSEIEPEPSKCLLKILRKADKLEIQKFVVIKLKFWYDKFNKIYLQFAVIKNFMLSSGMTSFTYKGDDNFDEFGKSREEIKVERIFGAGEPSQIQKMETCSENKSQFKLRQRKLVPLALEGKRFLKSCKSRNTLITSPSSREDCKDLYKTGKHLIEKLSKLINFKSKDKTDKRAITIFKMLIDEKYKVFLIISETTQINFVNESKSAQLHVNSTKNFNGPYICSSSEESIHDSDFNTDNDDDDESDGMDLYVFNRATAMRERDQELQLEKEKLDPENKRTMTLNAKVDQRLLKSNFKLSKAKIQRAKSLLSSELLDQFDNQVEKLITSERKVKSIAKEMDIGNSWHKMDIEQIDTVNEKSKNRLGKLKTNKNLKSSNSGPTSDLSKMMTLSSDLSVAVFNIPSVNEPILHVCNAKLASGAFCQRQDRFKCPFHGKIVDRDEDGVPLFGKSELVQRMFGDDNKKRGKRKKNGKSARFVDSDKEKDGSLDMSDQAVKKRLMSKMRKL